MKITDLTITEATAPPDMLERVVKDAIQYEVEAIVAAEAKEAAKRVEQKVREGIAGIATRVLDHMEFSRFGTTLQIRVDFNRREQ